MLRSEAEYPAGSTKPADIDTNGAADHYHSGVVDYVDLELYQRYVRNHRQRRWTAGTFWFKERNTAHDGYLSRYGNGPGWKCAGGCDRECGRSARLSANRQPDINYARAAIHTDIFGAGGNLGKH